MVTGPTSVVDQITYNLLGVDGTSTMTNPKWRDGSSSDVLYTKFTHGGLAGGERGLHANIGQILFTYPLVLVFCTDNLIAKFKPVNNKP